MTKLKKYSTINDWNSAKRSLKYPSIGYVNKKIKWMNRPAEPGDVAYWDGAEVKTIPLIKYEESLGTAIGVVVIPSVHMTDSKIRIISLHAVNESGGNGDGRSIKWSQVLRDTSISNYTEVPVWDNSGSSLKRNSFGYLPSDSFLGSISFHDSKARYHENVTEYFIPSPYAGNTKNRSYYDVALAHTGGYSDTQTLASLGEAYTAAYGCWNYSDGVSDLQWYLPSISELGFVAARYNVINNSLVSLGGIYFQHAWYMWSSTEYNYENVFYLNMENGSVKPTTKSDTLAAFPFATLTY